MCTELKADKFYETEVFMAIILCSEPALKQNASLRLKLTHTHMKSSGDIWVAIQFSSYKLHHRIGHVPSPFIIHVTLGSTQHLQNAAIRQHFKFHSLLCVSLKSFLLNCSSWSASALLWMQAQRVPFYKLFLLPDLVSKTCPLSFSFHCSFLPLLFCRPLKYVCLEHCSSWNILIILTGDWTHAHA